MKAVNVGQKVWYVIGTTIASGTVCKIAGTRISIESTTTMSNGLEQVRVPQAYETDVNLLFSSHKGAAVSLGKRLHGRK